MHCVYPALSQSLPDASIQQSGTGNDAIHHFPSQMISTASWNDEPSINWLPLDYAGMIDNDVFGGTPLSYSWDQFQFQPLPGVSPFQQQDAFGVQQPEHPIRSPLEQYQTPSSAATTSPATDQTESTRARAPQQGEYYVDGEPARLPRVKRRRLSTKHTPVTATSVNDPFSLAISRVDPGEPVYWHLEGQIPLQAYQELERAFDILCLTRPPNVPPDGRLTRMSAYFAKDFEPTFPSQKDFEHLWGLFTEYLLPQLPLLHVSSMHSLPWQLLLAGSVIGVHFIEKDCEHFRRSMCEFLRRIIAASREDCQWIPANKTAALQVQLFYVIATSRSSDEVERSSALAVLRELTSNATAQRQLESHGSPHTEKDWSLFIESQCFKRTYYAIFLLDAMLAYQMDHKPGMGLRQATLGLPCPEAVWCADTETAWSDLKEELQAQPSFLDALQKLYLEKTVSKTSVSLGGFYSYTESSTAHGRLRITISSHFRTGRRQQHGTSNRMEIYQIRSGSHPTLCS